jgi:hypothetical protein
LKNFDNEIKTVSKKLKENVGITFGKFDTECLKINSYDQPNMYRSGSMPIVMKKQMNLDLGTVKLCEPESKSSGNIFIVILLDKNKLVHTFEEALEEFYNKSSALDRIK